MKSDIALENKRSISQKLLLISLALILLSTIFASIIQTDGGKVTITGLTIPTQNGQYVSADLYKPKSATKDSKKPLVILVPGFQRSKETMTSYAIELARRDVVAIVIDPYAQGSSSSSMSRTPATDEGYGLIPLVDYVYNTPNLNYIDKTKIGAAGHSAGGNAAIRAANHFGTEAIASGQPSKLAAVYVSGYVLTLTDEVLSSVRSNVGISYALHDEGAYRNEKGNGDMRTAPEALRLVNSGLPVDGQVNKVEIGKLYGQVYNKTLRVVYNEKINHAFQPYTIENNAHILEFFGITFNLDRKLKISDQIWYLREILTLIALIGAFLFIVPFAKLLLKTPLFKSLVHKVPDALPKQDKKGKIIYWSVFALGALIACFSFMPLADLSKTLFTKASGSQQTWFFPERMNNSVLLWAVFNGTIGIIIFYLTYKLYGKKNGIKPDMWGMKTNVKEILKTILLALTVFTGFYGLVFTCYKLFHVDFRFLFIAARAFSPKILVVSLMYIPFFFIFYISNSIRVNGSMRIEGQKEWVSMLISGLANTVGLMLIMATQYVVFVSTGTVFWTTNWLYVNILFGLIPMMFILPIFNRIFFKMTGRVYLGAMVTCFIFIMMLLSNSVAYIPL
ncbi:alpha/beta hydrolase family protein [Sporosalibacterium faouarense]|uniref:alpha/beta hydrolase family protein n=1 Tax=Sporosalibacterium faouarense TaxID=516123 RepID=UPI00192BDC22|nr:alpha/beta hydrolase [Sporosalibacterium faouarense]